MTSSDYCLQEGFCWEVYKKQLFHFISQIRLKNPLKSGFKSVELAEWNCRLFPVERRSLLNKAQMLNWRGGGKVGVG